MESFRTPETNARYHALLDGGLLQKGCPLCAGEPLKTFVHWKIMPNAFPYDAIASRHDMIVPLRHISEEELTEDERKELREIKASYIAAEYEYIIEATQKYKTVPAHFHLHLIVPK